MNEDPYPSKRPRHLENNQRREILLRVDNGERKAALAKEYGISRAAVTKICQKRDLLQTQTQKLMEQENSGRSSKYDLFTVNKAIWTVLQLAEPLPRVIVDIENAFQYVLAKSVRSKDALPPFRASIMDGYAVVSSDGIGSYEVIGRGAAGAVPDVQVVPGTVAYVTTGAPVPPGADAVVKVEDTTAVYSPNGEEMAVSILRAVQRGQSIREIGSDIEAGAVVLEAGETLNAAEIGLLATTGVTQVEVFSKPKVGILSTGNELQDMRLAEDLGQGKIRDSNRPMLLAAMRELQAEAIDLGIGADNASELEEKVVEALKVVDVLITSGGVSMGEHDLIKPLLERIGQVHFGRIYMKPGKPTTFATVEVDGKQKLVFALPGNPVSSLVTCRLLVEPALKRLRGYQVHECLHPEINVKISHTIKLDSERPEYHRATLSWNNSAGVYIATSTGIQQSSRLLSCRNSNALLCLPRGKSLRTGQEVRALITGTLPPSPLEFSSHGKPSLSDDHITETISRTSPVPRTDNALDVSVCLLTVSDRCSAGKTVDRSGPKMAECLKAMANINVQILDQQIVPDNLQEIRSTVRDWCDQKSPHLILTSGGTGFSPRDVTPEAIKVLLEKEIPGFVFSILQASCQITPKAVLSRPVCGIRGETLILTLPGSSKAVSENLAAIESILPHAIHLIRDLSHGHHQGKSRPTPSKSVPACDCDV